MTVPVKWYQNSFLACMFFLHLCSYHTTCYVYKISEYGKITDYSLVEMKDANEEDLIDEEVVVAIYGDYEYFFESKTVYDFYLVQLGGIRGEYYSILDAIEEDQNVIDFLFDIFKDFSITYF